jgi:formylglycine-generating enzyme required for sulfatase activity
MTPPRSRKNEDEPQARGRDDALDARGRTRRRLVGLVSLAPWWWRAVETRPQLLLAGVGGVQMNDATQRAIAEKAKTLDLRVDGTVLQLLRVEPGSFNLGSPATEEGHAANEGPVRRITLTRAFYLGRHPVTQRQYTSVTGKPAAKPAGGDVAIDQLTYADALAFCALLTSKTGETVTLPTEAQWEYACRAGTPTRFWSGEQDADLARVGWYDANAGDGARAVGAKPANPWGFHDMHGNVCEFCRDALPPYASIPDVDPIGRTSDRAGIMRGGAWMHPAAYCRSATRLMSNDRFGGAGLRIAIQT